MNRYARQAMLVVCALALSGTAIAQQKISAKLAVPVNAAQESIKKKQWDQALRKIDEADSISGKTSFDQFKINELKAYVLYQQKKYREAAPLYEKGLDSGQIPADKVPERLQMLVSVNGQAGNFAKVAQFGDRLLKTGSVTAETRAAIAIAHYQIQDYRGAIPIMQTAIKATENAQKKVPENWLQLVYTSQAKIKDDKGAGATLEKLVLLYPTPAHWDYLLSTRISSHNKDRVQVNLLRLKKQVGVLKRPGDYMEMAEMLLDAGLPGEAQSVMQAGFDTKVFAGADKATADRAARRLNDASTAAAKSRQALPAIEQKARSAAGGQADVDLGLVYASFEQYEKAAESLSRGLGEGGVRDPQQAELMVGIANLRLGRKAEAVKTFQQVKDTDQSMVDVARLWALAARSNVALAAAPAAKPKGKSSAKRPTS